MTFPTGWGRKCKITIPAAQISGNNSNFPMLVALDHLPAEMVGGGANSALNGGGDIRFSEDVGGVTQLACEIVNFVTSATPGGRTTEIWVKLPTLNAGAAKEFYVWYNKVSETQPLVTDPFGRNAVWADYEFSSHNSRIDSTGNHVLADTGSSSGGPQAAIDPFGNTSDCSFLTNTDRVMSTNTLPNLTSFTFQNWYYYNSGRTGRQAAGAYRVGASGSSRVTLVDGTEWDGTNSWLGSSIAPTPNQVWRMSHVTWDSATKRTSYRDAVEYAADTSVTDVTGKNTLTLGAGQTGYGESIDGRVAETRLRSGLLSLDWMTTEYNNQSNPLAFASAGIPETGGGTATVSLQNTSHSLTSGILDLTQIHSLAIDYTTHALAGPNIIATLTIVVPPNGAGHGVMSEAVTLSQGQLLVVSEVNQWHGADSPALSQSHDLAIWDGGHGHTSDNAGFLLLQSLMTQNAVHSLNGDMVPLFNPGIFITNPARTQKVVRASRTSSPAADNRKI